ncbi:hypothetical protein ElyMa_006157400 [Elysia marginata]|uniref:Uncharacterized protein n=1 Tax=Elysia marginata TaxID=1093978 RepID=A0AAV4GYF2_9GAST|nr:hypothetical protein ElyMa_006157400 [Elysia marginata]
MLGRGVEKFNCHAMVSRVSSFHVDIGQAVFDLMGNLADCRHAPDMVQTKHWDFSPQWAGSRHAAVYIAETLPGALDGSFPSSYGVHHSNLIHPVGPLVGPPSCLPALLLSSVPPL